MRPKYLNNFSFTIESTIYEFYHGKFYKRLDVLGPGKSFGERAIQNRKLQPLAIRSDTDAEYAVLTKEGYEASLKTIADEFQRAQIKFLKQQPSLQTMANGTITRLIHIMAKMRFERDQIIFEQGKK